MRVEFLGHAGFLIEGSGTCVAIDPFLSGNPVATRSVEDIKVDLVLVTHAHQDHLGDTVAIAKANDALVISTAEIANMLQAEGCRTRPMHIGGTAETEFGSVRLTQAIHGSGIAGGLACGFVVDFWGHTIYHAGDTALFGDMELLADLIAIDIALLPIGGNFTMDAADAVVAVAMLDPETVIPMHYNTFPVVQADPEQFKAEVEANSQAKVVVLQPGEALEL